MIFTADRRWTCQGNRAPGAARYGSRVTWGHAKRRPGM